jgi:hypothetical protein
VDHVETGPEEFIGVAQEIAARIGEVLGVDESNDGIKDPRFCVRLSSGNVAQVLLQQF